MNKKDIIPFKATHPGEMIKDEIKERGMTQKKLAELTGREATCITECCIGFGKSS